MRNTIVLIVLIVALLSCKKEEFDNSTYRIRNNTPYTFKNVYIKIGASENNYGSLKPNETSVYKSFPNRDYPDIKISTEDKDFEFQIRPFDAPPAGTKVSKQATAPLTFVVSVNPTTNSLDYYFEE